MVSIDPRGGRRRRGETSTPRANLPVLPVAPPRVSESTPPATVTRPLPPTSPIASSQPIPVRAPSARSDDTGPIRRVAPEAPAESTSRPAEPSETSALPGSSHGSSDGGARGALTTAREAEGSRPAGRWMESSGPRRPGTRPTAEATGRTETGTASPTRASMRGDRTARPSGKAATAGRDARAPRRTRPAAPQAWRAVVRRRALGPVPVAGLVGLQLLALGVVVALHRRPVAVLVIGILLALAGLLLLVPVGQWTLGGWLFRRLRAVATPTVLGADEVTHANAVFPGFLASQIVTPRGRPIGIMAWSGGLVSLVAVSPTARSASLPIGTIWERMRAAGLEIEALGVHDHLTPQTMGETVISVRIRPDRARRTILERGSGRQGMEAAMSTAVALVVSEAAAAGWRPEVLGGKPGRMRLSELLEPPLPAGTRPVWHGAWRRILGPSLAHTMLVAHRVDDIGALQTLRTDAPDDEWRWTTLVVTPDADGTGCTARVLVRVAGASPAEAARAAAECAPPGMHLVPVLDGTIDALRASSPLGPGRPWADRCGAAAGGPLDITLAATTRSLDAVYLSPVTPGEASAAS